MTGIDPDVIELAREEANDCLDRIVATLLALEAGQADGDAVDSIFRDAHSIKGSAGMVGWTEASSIAHAMEDKLEQLRAGGSMSEGMTDAMLRATDALRRAIAGEAGVADAAIADLAGNGTAAVTVGTAPGGEPDVNGEPTTAVELATNGEPDAAEAAVAESSEPVAGSEPVERKSIRVAAEKVDRMLDAVGETVLHHRRLEHAMANGDERQEGEVVDEELDMGERLLDELQDSVIQMRTLPLSSITSQFPRAVRDLAISQGKEVDLEIRGADTQLDRVILDGISEMITHLLRNAVAHGIELPEEREDAGKPPRATIKLSAEQRGSLVAIQVADDGRGVPAELVEEARDRGESITELLAAAGFSTADEISDVAGRGVGLDAVKAHVENLGGNLEVRSEPGEGTEVIMLLPLTLALLTVLLFERGGRPFGLPLPSVGEVIAVDQTTSLTGQRSLELRGESIPLDDLAKMIGAVVPELPERPPALILSAPGRRVAVLCDQLLGDQEVVTKSLGPLLAGMAGYLGAAILGDGRVALILDPNHLLKRPTVAAAGAAKPVAATPERVATKVLVVDDRFTVRELQRSILESAGYDVEVARDGREALERLGAVEGIRLVLTDLEMPVMDGLELLTSIRDNPERSSLPVVIVTSRGSDEDKRRGIEAGADAYIVKDEFDQRTLLDTLERLIGR